MILVTAIVALTIAMAAQLLGGPRRFMRGRHVSKFVVRRIGLAAALRLRVVVSWAGIPFVYMGTFAPYAVLIGVVAAWAIDDLLFPDDDEKRKHEWAKVRLRMPKPVKLRAVERWKPVPA